ncbi:methyl-accepting chemotaxis protein [Pseudomonas psychrotolerans]|nr:methyl-accepting chemotaxis protein [Pseudomonas psychrotolerans]MDR6678841.1 methyl-accepting chemotaxis protein [Pseudomonas psychrotolerans]
MIRRLNISARAYISFIAIGVLVSILALVAVQSLRTMRSVQVEVGQRMLPIATSTNRLTELTLRLRVLSYWLLANREPATVERITGLIKQRYSQLKAQEESFEHLLVNDEERQLYAPYAAAMKDYAQLFPQLLQLSEQGRLEELRTLLNGVLNENHNVALSQLTKIADWLEARSKQVNDTGAADYDRLLQVFLTLVFGVFVLGGVCAWAIVRSIQRPLRDTVGIADRIAQGDLTGSIQPVGNDELTALQRSIQTMQDRLAQTLGVITQTAERLKLAANDLQATAEVGSSVAEEGNDQVVQVATAFNEMSVAVQEVAGNAVTTAQISRTSADMATNGNRLVNDAIAAVQSLTIEVKESAGRVDEFAQQATHIHQILASIRAVADQTNLLALNAAIEAARAGELGRGFAVVADEVRALASRTQASTREIEHLVGVISQGTEQAAGSIRRSVNSAAATLEVVQEAGATFAEISNTIGEISERNQVIASAAEEQASVTREVERNLERIREMAGTSSENSQSTRAASQGLAEITRSLEEILKRFRLS